MGFSFAVQQAVCSISVQSHDRHQAPICSLRRRSGAVEQRAKEAGNINKSLLTLVGGCSLGCGFWLGSTQWWA